MRRPTFHLLLLSGFLLLTALLTYPLIAQFSTHVPGSTLWAFDEYTFVWNLWWFQHAVLVLQQSPLASDFIFYPVGIDFTLYTFVLFNAAAGLPLTAFLPLPFVSNLLTFFGMVFSGYGAFLLARWLMRTTPAPAGDAAAVVAGIAYAFTTSKFVSLAIGHANFAATEWIPFSLLTYLRAMETGRRRDGLLCGLFFALALYVEMNFGVFLALFIAVHWLVEKPWRRLGKTAVVQVAAVGASAALIFMPVLIPVARAFATADYALKGWGDALKLSVDLLGFVSPSAISSWAGLDWSREQIDVIKGAGRFADVNTVFLGYATLALAAIGAFANRRAARLWAVAALVFGILALGPLIQINGVSTFDFDGVKVNIPLPFIVFHYIPVVQANRVPNRFSVVLVLALALLAGYAVRRIWEAIGARQGNWGMAWAGTALLSALVITDHLAVPLPLTDARVPPFYESLAADQDDYAILQLPLGWRNSFGTLGAEDTRVQYYQSIHHKRILGGNTSRNHPSKFDYYRSLPIVSSLLQIEDYKAVDADQRNFDKATADEFVRFFDIRYVVVHPAVAGRKPYDDTREKALEYLKDVLPMDPVPGSGDLLVFRVRRTPSGRDVGIDLGEPTARPYLAEGWEGEEVIAGRRANWAGPRARLLVRLPEPRDYVLRFAAMPFSYPNAPGQTVTGLVNGTTRLPPIALESGWQEREWTVAASSLRAGMNEVQFEFGHAQQPSTVLGGDDTRTLSAAFDWIEWRAR